jgi:hypothetical protein
MIQSKASGEATQKPARRPKPPKSKWVGFLPSSAPFHKMVHGCFTKAGFNGIRVGINKDYSLATFWLKRGAHLPFRGRKQAKAALFRLLRAEGVNLEAETLAVAMEGDSICGAFIPPQCVIA